MATVKEVPPYIGVTGVTGRWQVRSLLARFSGLSVPQYRLMIGVLVSLKSLSGCANKYPARYPEMRDLRWVFLNHPWCLNLVHYHTDDRNTLASQMREVERWAGSGCNGFQLNVAWPPVSELIEWRKDYNNEDKYLVLQIGGGAMRQCDDDPLKVAERASHYSGLVDYVLVDPSGGTGRKFDPDLIRETLQVIEEEGLSARPVVAGGLGPGNLEHLIPVLSNYRNRGLSIDAEGKLRTPKPDDALDMNLAQDYIIEAGEILQRFAE